MMNYLICATGRARSGVLAAYLRKLDVGRPDEFYEHVRFDLCSLSQEAEIKAYIEERRSNGIFGMKMVWSHVYRMHKTVGLNLETFIDTYMPDPKYLFVVRDPVKQAVESVMYGMRKQGLPFEKRHFDFDASKQRMTRIVIGNTAWQIFFEKHNIDWWRCTVDANDLETDPVTTMQHVLVELGIERPIEQIEKLGNHFKDSLMNEFRDEMCESLLRRHVLMMDDINIKEFL